MAASSCRTGYGKKSGRLSGADLQGEAAYAAISSRRQRAFFDDGGRLADA